MTADMAELKELIKVERLAADVFRFFCDTKSHHDYEGAQARTDAALSALSGQQAAGAASDHWLAEHDAGVSATVLTTVLSKVAELSPAAREPLRGYISLLEDSIKDLLPTPLVAKPAEEDPRMDAYHYGFERTGIGVVDQILSAVSYAGNDGRTPEERTQDAANDAADAIRERFPEKAADAVLAVFTSRAAGEVETRYHECNPGCPDHCGDGGKKYRRTVTPWVEVQS